MPARGLSRPCPFGAVTFDRAAALSSLAVLRHAGPILIDLRIGPGMLDEFRGHGIALAQRLGTRRAHALDALREAWRAAAATASPARCRFTVTMMGLLASRRPHARRSTVNSAPPPPCINQTLAATIVLGNLRNDFRLTGWSSWAASCPGAASQVSGRVASEPARPDFLDRHQ